MQAFKEFGEVPRGEHGRGASTEVEGGDCAGVQRRRYGFSFSKNGLDKGALVGVTGGVFVKRTVGADPVAKGDMNIDNQKLKTETLRV